MSISTAIQTAVRGLNVVQEQIANSSNNIANVETPGYIKQRLNQASLVVAGRGQGAFISSVDANVDDQLLIEMRRTSSTLEKSNRLEEFYESIVSIYGNPDAGNDLSAKLDDFYSEMQNLSDSPQSASLRVSTVRAAEEVANKLSGMADDLQQLRFEADQELSGAVSAINSILNRLYRTNQSVGAFPEGTEGRVVVDRERAIALRELSEFIDITTTEDSGGLLFIMGAGGTTLLDFNQYQLRYSAASSKETFISDGFLNPIQVVPLDINGDPEETGIVDLTTSGTSSTIQSNISDGVLRGMLDLRDDTLPALIEQLDSFANVFRDEVNALHNEGTSFPPPTSITGVNAISNNTEVGFNGSVRIVAVDQDGTPPSSPYANETFHTPLTLDLASLDSGSGAGTPTVQTIMDEINLHYGPAQSRATVGNVRDIRLAAVSNTIPDGGTAQFDLELDNVSTQDSTVVVQAITVFDASDLSVGYNPSTLPVPNSYEITAGSKERTNIPLTVDFSGGDNATTYVVRVRVQVTQADGTVSSADIDYNIDDNVTDIKNDRYVADAVTNVTGTSAFIPAPTSQSYLRADLVDANGSVVTAGQAGFLQIRSSDGNSYGIAIDNLNSEEVGTPTTPTADITNRSFSHFFGLNDLFLRNNEQVAGSAINMQIRSDIAQDSNNLAVGTLTLSNQPSDTDQALYTYELGAGNSETVRSLAALGESSATFSATSTFSQTSTSFNAYANNMTGFVSTQKNIVSGIREIAQVEFEGLQIMFQDTAGVNTDEELAIIVQLENDFRAMSQVISVARSMLEILSSILR